MSTPWGVISLDIIAFIMFFFILFRGPANYKYSSRQTESTSAEGEVFYKICVCVCMCRVTVKRFLLLSRGCKANKWCILAYK